MDGAADIILIRDVRLPGTVIVVCTHSMAGKLLVGGPRNMVPVIAQKVMSTLDVKLLHLGIPLSHMPSKLGWSYKS